MIMNCNSYSFMPMNIGMMNYPMGSGIASLFSGVPGMNVMYNSGCCMSPMSTCCGSPWGTIGLALGNAITTIGGLFIANRIGRAGVAPAEPTESDKLNNVESDKNAKAAQKEEKEAALEEANAEKIEAQSKKDTLAGEITELDTKIKAKAEEIDGLGDDAGALKKQGLTEEYNSLKAEKAKKEAELKAAEDKLKADSELNKKIKSLGKEITALEAEIDQLENDAVVLNDIVHDQEEDEALRKAAGTRFSRIDTEIGKNYKITDNGVELKHKRGKYQAQKYEYNELTTGQWQGMVQDYIDGTASEKKAIKAFLSKPDVYEYATQHVDPFTARGLQIIKNREIEEY